MQHPTPTLTSTPTSLGRLALAAAATLAFAGVAAAQQVVVLGDNTPAFLLADEPDNAGNRRFFTNVLGDSDAVFVLDSENGTGPGRLDTFYGSLPGVSSTLGGTTFDATSLDGVDLFVSAVPDDDFTAAEVAALADFSAAGGDLLLLGESGTATTFDFGPQTNASISTLLSDLGISIEIVPGTGFDGGGTQPTVAGQVVADPLTAGVSDFLYGAASEVAGGRPLLLGSDLATPFAAAVSVPEPATLSALLLAPLLLTRRR